jgi:hypothetical protein
LADASWPGFWRRVSVQAAKPTSSTAAADPAMIQALVEVLPGDVACAAKTFAVGWNLPLKLRG